jgi:predicted MFS family arabinose efflux permease
LVSVQGLDGIGAAIFGVLLGIVAADLSKGKGRFNLIQGVIITGMGIGSTVSQLLGGWLSKVSGYNTAFLALSGAALIGFVFFWFFMPETKTSIPAEALES